MKRKYLSETCADYQCLEHHLAQGNFGELPDENLHKLQHDDDNTMLVFDEMKRRNTGLMQLDTENISSEVARLIAELVLPTRFDSPWGYQAVSSLLETLKQTAEELELDTSNFPLHATVPTGQVNAMAVNLPCSKKTFLLFDPQLLTFCNLIAKLYAQCLTPNVRLRSGDVKILHAVVGGSPEIADRLKGVLEAFVKTGRPGTSLPFAVDAESIRLCHTFRTGMELFVVGHEFGHVYSGHLSKLLTRLHMASPNFGQSDSHREEYEADYLGLILTVYALQKKGGELWEILGSIKLFFSSLDLASRYADFRSYGARRKFVGKESDTHPSNEGRMQAIDRAIESFGMKAEDIRMIEQFNSLINETTALLWQAITKTTSKAGNNDLCPCGSKKKYKKCCRK
ncbi:SEC-C metal-binding domain-containing protein [Pseudomonas syringae]|uniref:SEC-C metal-binding domain-containing protein n=1 Tax=Pseudomonas syringae TaxID=317 RepID=UPI0003F9551C|nr:SEC-C metal-binding domain-containing protein [Pseudomonas syringae]